MPTGLVHLAVEFAVLYVLLPTLLATRVLRWPAIPTLWVAAGACLAWLATRPGFAWGSLWRPPADLERWTAVALALCVPAVAALTAVVWRVDPGQLFALPRRDRRVWATILLLYPTLSVVPQGIVYRAFLFERYGPLFPGRWTPLAVATLAFSFGHVVFRNWVAPAACLLGGLAFAAVYVASGSFLAATVVHTVLGCWIFTVGLGPYFIHATVR